MLTTPFFVMGYERFLMRRLDRPVERAPDAIRETNPVIVAGFGRFGQVVVRVLRRSEEHTSELQSRLHLVCRLLLEKKKKNRQLRIGKLGLTERIRGVPTTGLSS